MKKKLCVFMLAAFAVLTFFSSCGVVKNCDEIGMEFYRCLRDGNYEGVLPLLDKEALKYTPEEKWIDGLKYKAKSLGAMFKPQRIAFETVTMERVTRVGIKYKVIYAGADMYEKLEFIERDGEYKITFYQYNPDSLLVD
ncbi:MAG: hypothetical protein IIU03_11930 [Bacteroidales bacterium]|nr:hypothetical protein [Bacteroidales bacterium]MBQ5540930.1 hypothetical protein [Bacteroidales bacterium]MEE3447632.1 hypothetical protein [Bacteroidales bacterium]